MTYKKITLILLVLTSLIGAVYFYSKNSPIPEPLTVVCTEEAKLCTDGSSVGRTGSNCESAECPVSQIPQIKEGTTTALNQKILNAGVFITPREVVTDSRCPVDVVCVWAGEVSLKVLLEKGTVQSDVVLKLQTPVIFENNTVTLTGVLPEHNSKKSLSKEEYRFTFSVASQEIPVVIVPKDKCYTGGCSGQLCSDQLNMVSTCEYKPEYACYQTAICERQMNGKCGWTETPALLACLATKS